MGAAARVHAADMLFDRKGIGPGDAYRCMRAFAIECRQKIKDARSEQRRESYYVNAMPSRRPRGVRSYSQ
jgi:hypothetical protein